MGSTFNIKQDDTLPRLRATLRNPDGTVIDLTSATQVKFQMAISYSTTKKVDGVCTVVNASAGIVEYSWVSADTDSPGQYEGEFFISWPGGVQRVPNSEYINVVVKKKVAG